MNDLKTQTIMKKTYTIKNFAKRLVMVLTIGMMAVNVWSATTYKLTQITSSSNVVAGKYVFEDEDGDWVLMPSISSSNLQSTSTYSTTGLSGSESYVWTVASATGGWYLKNSSGNYFRNSSSTNMSFTTSDQTNIVWTFNFYTDGTISIQNNETERYIGVNGANIKPYTDTYIYYYKMYLLEEECSKSVTIQAANSGTGTNCTFSLGTTGAQASCDGVSTTVSITPTMGYGNPIVSQSGASKTPSITGSGNSQTVTYQANTTGTSTINVSCSANTYTVTLNDNTGSGGSGSKTVTYNANTNLTTSITVPTKAHHDFAGYWTSTDAGSTFGTKLVNADGSWVASAGGGSTYTDGSKNWKYADNITLYAKWTEHDLKNYRTICCTPLGEIDGDVTLSQLATPNATKLKATWTMDAETGIDSYNLEVYDNSDNLVKTINGYTSGEDITGLDPCTTYYVALYTVSDGDPYCDGGLIGISDDVTTIGYTYTVNATNCQLKSTSDPVPDNMCEGDVLVYYEATGTSILPDDITVTNAGDEGTGWWWDSSTGELGIDADYVTGDVVVTIFASCADYSFIYGTTKGSENNFECFSFVTGSTDTWLTDLWTIPSADQWTYVGEPSWNTSTGKSANLQLSNMPYALNHANNLGTIGTNRMEGAQGYLKICSNSTDANRYVGFIPAGYVFRWGTDGSGWNSIAFTGKTSDIEEEDWNTPLQTWTSSNADDYTYVGLKTSSGYVWANRSETRRPVFLDPGSGWKADNAKFVMYYWDGSSHTGYSAIMTDPDGDGIYEAWIPNDYAYTNVLFGRLNPVQVDPVVNWDNKWNKTSDLSLPSDKNLFTITGGSDDAYTGSWSLYDKKGTFHISANSNTNNWYCHFLPHHVLHYDANGGEGAPADQSIAINASPCQLTVSTTEPTRTGYTFAGWNESSSAASKDDDWDGGDTHTMSGDVTLYAVWTPNTNTPYTVKHYKMKLDGTYPASPDETDNLTGTTGAEITPDRKSYEGFTAPSGTTTTILADGSRVVEYQYSRNSYTLTWTTDGDDLTGSYTKGSTKYEASITAPDTPTKTGYTFAGWNNGSGVVTPATTMPAAATTYTATWTANTNTAYTVKHYKQKLDGTYPASPDDTDNLTGTTGASITPDRKSYTGFTAPSGTTTTILADGSRIVEYQYTRNKYNVTVAAKSDVTITATPASGSAIAEESNADVLYEKTVTLNYSSLTSGLTFGGWKVTKTDDASVSVTVSGSGNGATFAMPAYAVNVTAIVYSVGIAWCDPDVTVTGDVHLTSTKDVPVRYSTSGSDNLITISSSDMGSATTMEVAYLNADAADAEVDKDDSPFRFYKADGSATTEALDLDYEWTTSHPIRYTPSGFGVTNNYKLKLTFKRGDKVLKTINKPIYGRGLPEEFVIAVKKGDQWVALPSNLASTSAQPSIVPQVITVNNTETPTAAAYAPTTTVYKAMTRGNDAHISALRFTTTGTNYLQVSGVDGTYNMWLSGTNSADVQDWQLKSSDFNAYELTIPSTSATKKMGIYNSTYMGYHGSPNNANIYLLPITNKYTEIAATVSEWGQNSVVLAANPGASANKAQAHIDDGSPTEKQDITAINGVIGTAKNVKVPLGDIDLDVSEGNEGKLLYIDWFNGSTLLGTSMVTIPRIVAEDRTANKTNDTDKKVWNTEVHVLPGATLTIDGESFKTGVINSTVSVNELQVYPGATINMSTGTLAASTLRLRNGWTRAGEKAYDVARVYIADDAALTKTTATMDYDIYELADGQHFYPLAVPFPVAVSAIDYADSWLAGYSEYGMEGQYVIKEYDGARRAERGPDRENNWKVVNDDATLTPGKGYIMAAVPVYGEAIIRVPLTYNDAWTADGEKATAHYDDADHTKNVVTVTAHTGKATEGDKKANKGWNLLGVPFMSCYTTSDDMYEEEGSATVIQGKYNFVTGEWIEEDIRYVNVPTHDFSEYIQADLEEDDPVTVLVPGWCFFVQIDESGDLTFLTAAQAEESDLPIYAPKREQENMPTMKTGIILSDGEKSDKTTFFVSDKYSAAEYEINADLEKMFGSGYTLATYSLSGETRLAYNALSNADAANVIPIGYRAPADGEYTFAINPKYAENGAFEHVNLIDYETGSVTDLLQYSYTFSTGRTQNDSRFALNVVPRQETPTDVGDISSEKSTVRKVIINDKLYIIMDGKMYDATGKKVREINK